MDRSGVPKEFRDCLSGDGTVASLGDCRLAAVPEWLRNLASLTELRLDSNELVTLPDWLGDLTSLRVLRLNNNELVSLPETLGNLADLTHLYLDGNRLANLPDGLMNLTSLTWLDADSNELMSLPDTLGSLASLTDLYLSNNELVTVPETIGYLLRLTRLYLGGNRLASVPDTVGNLPSLTELHLNNNKLTSVPDALGRLSGLTRLDLNGNRLVSLPESLGNLARLTRLDADNNELESVPGSLGNLPSLTDLYLDNNRLTSVPESLGNLASLTRLYLNGNRLTSVPESLGNLASLTDLYLDGNALVSVPESLGNLASLTRLYLDGNALVSVPESLGNLGSLTRLVLSSNRLVSLPESLGNLPSLTRLYLSNNELVSVPESLGNLPSLTELHLNGNRLTSMPESLGNLGTLTRLDLNGNRLVSVPESLGNLYSLTRLYLNDNALVSVPESLGNLGTLTRLDLDGNELVGLPESLGDMPSLIELHLSNNWLADVPDTLGNLPSLTRLHLDGNKLTSIPESLGNLPSLTRLVLDNNKLVGLPESLGNLPSLTRLHLNGNQLVSVPGSLGNLARLTTLRLADNQLVSVPDSLGNLARLTTLRLNGNQLVSVPESLGNLVSLTTLNLIGNQLVSLPESLGNLEGLGVLGLGGNPLRSPLLEIANDGTAAVKTYLSLLQEHSTELWKSKLLVVGEGHVGKTSLIKALAGEQHDPDEPTTHGIRIADIEIPSPAAPDRKMRLSGWDFGGQDIYHATHQFFLSDRSLLLLLWNSRQGWEQARLPYWLDIIRAKAPNARVILIATHAHGRPVDLPLAELRDTYPQIKASVSVDNRTREGISELSHLMAEEAARLPLMGSRWPETWVTGLNAITQSNFDKQYATPDELYKKLTSLGISERSHQMYLLRALHVLGDILYFDEDEDLQDIVILRPQWVNGYIARVLDSSEVAEKHGLLTRSHERELWSDLDPGLRDRFLLMMEKFDLSYRIPDDPTASSLVVELLRWENPPYKDIWDAALQDVTSREIRLVYKLSTLPPGVPTWFIAREHRFSTSTHWRGGALFRHSGDPRVLGLVRADRQDRTVDLTVRGPVPQLFFSILQDGLESTLSRYQGLEIIRLVPCSCNQGDGTQENTLCKHLYRYAALKRRLERRIPDIECELSGARVNVADLLFAIAPASTDEILGRVLSLGEQTTRIGSNVAAVRSEVAFSHRELLKALRQQQSRMEAVCPSLFTLTEAAGRFHRPGFRRLQLRLYCEQPGELHALPGDPYIIDQPAYWLKVAGPYLVTVVRILKHAAPLAGPVLGLTADYLAKELVDQIELTKELISQLPDDLRSSEPGIPDSDDLSRGMRDVDYRALRALLRELDPGEQWGGLGRTYTPEGEILWLCGYHAQQYGT